MISQQLVNLLRTASRRAVREALGTGSEMLRRLVVEELTRGSSVASGRVYRRRGRAHVASKKGDPPAVDTGRLRAAISARVFGDSAEVGVLAAARYGRILEERLDRPFLKPTLKANEQAIYEAMSKRLEAVMRGAL